MDASIGLRAGWMRSGARPPAQVEEGKTDRDLVFKARDDGPLPGPVWPEHGDQRSDSACRQGTPQGQRAHDPSGADSEPGAWHGGEGRPRGKLGVDLEPASTVERDVEPVSAVTRGLQVVEAHLAQDPFDGRQLRSPEQDVDLGSGGEGLRWPGILSNAVGDAGAIKSAEC